MEIREQHGSFFLNKITSVWGSEKGRAWKVPEKYLGNITRTASCVNAGVRIPKSADLKFHTPIKMFSIVAPGGR